MDIVKRNTFSPAILLLAASLLGGGLSAQQNDSPFDATVDPLQSELRDSKLIERLNQSLEQIGGSTSPTVSSTERETLQQVIALMDTGSLDAAVNFLRPNVTPESSAALDFYLATLYYNDNQFEPAKRYFRSAIEKFPNFLSAHRTLGLLEARQDDLPEAEKHLTRAIELGDRDPTAYGVLGFIYQQTGRLVSAEAAYRNAMILMPGNEDWKVNLASVLLEEGKYDEAAALFEQLIQSDPSDERFWLAQSNAFLQMEEYARAVQNIEIVHEMGKAKADVLRQLGNLYLNLDAPEVATEAFMASIEEAPEGDPGDPIDTASFLVRYGSYTEADQLLGKVQEVYGERLTEQHQLDVLTLRSRIELAQGNAEEAVPILEEILNRDPLQGQALLTLANHFSNSERPEEVKQADLYFERATELDAEPEFLAEAHLRYGIFLVRQDEYQKALEQLRLANSFEEDDYIRDYIRQVEQIRRSRPDV